MATVFWTGNQKATRRSYVFTVTAAAVSGTLTAQINSKTETYTCETTTAATEAAAFVAALSSSLIRELANFTFSSDGAEVTALGPADGMPLAITFGAAGGSTISAVTTVAPTSPHAVDDASNWSGGVPTNGDTAVFENTAVDCKYNLSALTAVTFSVVKRKSYGGQIGLPDTNPLGYPEYLAKFLETAGTGTHTVEDNGTATRLRLTSASATTVVVTGEGGGALNSESVELYGTSHSSSVLRVNGGAVAVAPTTAQTAVFGTCSVANGVLRCGPNCTLTTVTANNSQAEIGGAYTTLVIDRGSAVSAVKAAAAATSTTVEDGTLNWGSTGGWGALTIGSGGTVDANLAPSSITSGTITLNEGCTLNDPNERIAKTYNLVVNGELANMTLDLGTTFNLAVS
jgi:hypothetical protein